MSRIRIGVIGAGHLGRIHARLLTNINDVRLVGVADTDVTAGAQLAELHSCASFPSHRDLIGQVDAAVIAAPTTFHHPIAADLLRHDIHLLVEKPIALTESEADDLVRIAAQRNLVLQVGHVERFNPAFTTVAPTLQEPRYVESVRSGGFTCRSTDVGVVMDLMIHDLDIILSLVNCDPIDLRAIGATVIGPHEDMAQARLEFANGCVANLTASRVSFNASRHMRIFCRQAYASIDFAKPSVDVIRPSEALLNNRVHVDDFSEKEREQFRKSMFQSWLPHHKPEIPKANALLEELRDFVQCVATGKTPRVDGHQGRAALKVARRIIEEIERHSWLDQQDPRPLPHAIPLNIHAPDAEHHPPLPQRKAG